MALLQDRLDVQRKTRSNPFNWRGQFTPDFINYLLTEFASQSDILLDPFAGSGTLLYEGLQSKIEAHGLEINPAAYAMSKFYTLSKLSLEERLCLTNLAKELLFSKLGPNQKEENAPELLRSIFESAEDSSTRTLLINTFMSAERAGQVRIQQLPETLKRLSHFLLTLPTFETDLSIKLADARTAHRYFSGRVNLIITSPPYINVFNYHQNHRQLLESVGWSLLRVADSEFGSNRKNRGNRFKTVVQYTLDMEQALQSLWNCLVPGGKIVLIVGRQSNVRGIAFYNGQIVQELLSESSFTVDSRHQRRFVNRFGEEICEDVIVAMRGRDEPTHCVGHEIARSHLERALNKAEGEVKANLLDAIASVSSISSSPIFDRSTALTNARHTA